MPAIVTAMIAFLGTDVLSGTAVFPAVNTLLDILVYWMQKLGSDNLDVNPGSVPYYLL